MEPTRGKGVGVPVRGGTLDIRTSVAGTASRLVQSDLDGSFSLTGAELPSSRKGGKTVPLTVARGEFRRRGNTIDLNNLRAEAANAKSGRAEIAANAKLKKLLAERYGL